MRIPRNAADRFQRQCTNSCSIWEIWLADFHNFLDILAQASRDPRAFASGMPLWKINADPAGDRSVCT